MAKRCFFGRKLLVYPHFVCAFEGMDELLVLRPLNLDDLIGLVEKSVLTDVFKGLGEGKRYVFISGWMSDFIAFSSIEALAAGGEKEHNQFIE